ncbi:hypothetical protein HK103_007587 [Boothiomyces macroporosus]|uniref:L domain-like protein n=1 Tax=Boothiomyces macroporosus TaxID=261099 RepID=A0AAD5UBU2_9FUNG|nr:hypothetical protein HK103_007587 [Boothiomyces macroporosus]
MSTDCPAFYNLFKSLGGNDPTLTADNCCTWADHKVVCKDQRVFQVKLELMGLNGTISSDIGKLNALKSFSIASNNVTGVLPPEITIPRYAVFDVDDNNLYGPIPELAFDNSYTFYYVEFHHNAFTGPIPQSYYTANITANGQDNGGCPFDSNLCPKTPPPGCANVKFTCTNVPPRYPVVTPIPSPTVTPVPSPADGGFFSHIGNVIGLAVGVVVLIAAVVGLSLVILAKKKQVDDLKMTNSPQTTSTIQNYIGQQTNQFQTEGGYLFDPVSGSSITNPQYVTNPNQLTLSPILTLPTPPSPSLQSVSIAGGNPIASQPFISSINGQPIISTMPSPSVHNSLPSISPTIDQMAPDTPTVDPQFATLGTLGRQEENQEPRLIQQEMEGDEPRLVIESPKIEELEIIKKEGPTAVEYMPPTLSPDTAVEIMPPTIPSNFLAEMKELRDSKSQ